MKVVLDEYQQIKVNNFYKEGLAEVLCGVDIKYLYLVLEDMELDELYEECAGLKKAIVFAETHTMKEVELEFETITE